MLTSIQLLLNWAHLMTLYFNVRVAQAHGNSHTNFLENETEATWNFRNDDGVTRLIGSSILNPKGEFFSISEDEVKIGFSLKNDVK